MYGIVRGEDSATCILESEKLEEIYAKFIFKNG